MFGFFYFFDVVYCVPYLHVFLCFFPRFFFVFFVPFFSLKYLSNSGIFVHFFEAGQAHFCPPPPALILQMMNVLVKLSFEARPIPSWAWSCRASTPRHADPTPSGGWHMAKSFWAHGQGISGTGKPSKALFWLFFWPTTRRAPIRGFF